ncbi:MAG: radical SAM protein [Acidobacteriota bacterium]
MAVELRPLGVACNIGCRYCYQNPQRDAGNVRQKYDLEKMRAAVEREGGPFTLFGGEPLLLPLAALEELFRWGFEKYGRSGMQTNAVLIGDEHLRIFRDYNVDVGVSIDGPGEHNDLRWDGSLEKTRRSTVRTEENIVRLVREHRPPGLIVTLHRVNATDQRLPRMYEWMRELDALGIQSVRLHALEVDSPAMRQYTLSDEENARAFLGFAKLQSELKQLRFDVLGEVQRALMGRDAGTSCVWRACDPYSTEAVRGVEGNGQSSNCGRTNKDGVDFIKADVVGYERYLALQQTPQEEGGCKGCRFFLMCRGQCPGTAIDGDWRNRSELCGLWKRLFIHAEKELILSNQIPLTVLPLRHRMERHLSMLWEAGRNSTVQNLQRTEPASQAPVKFTLPSFVRRTFVGEAQRATWQPRFEAIAAAIPRIALAAVAGEAVPAAIVELASDDLLALRREATARGLPLTVVEVTGQTQQRRRVLIGSGESVPACCRNADVLPADRGAFRSRPLHLLRPLGIDFLGYTPCSFDCERSQTRADALLDVAREEAPQAAEWLDAILGWPVEWTALHGIAEIKTAIVKVAYDTAYTASKVTVHHRGISLPPDAARGLTHAYQAVRA